MKLKWKLVKKVVTIDQLNIFRTQFHQNLNGFFYVKKFWLQKDTHKATQTKKNKLSNN